MAKRAPCASPIQNCSPPATSVHVIRCMQVSSPIDLGGLLCEGTSALGLQIRFLGAFNWLHIYNYSSYLRTIKRNNLLERHCMRYMGPPSTLSWFFLDHSMIDKPQTPSSLVSIPGRGQQFHQPYCTTGWVYSSCDNLPVFTVIQIRAIHSNIVSLWKEWKQSLWSTVYFKWKSCMITAVNHIWIRITDVDSIMAYEIPYQGMYFCPWLIRSMQKLMWYRVCNSTKT